MKKLLAIAFLVLFAGSLSAPSFATNSDNSTVITIKVNDEKPKKDKAETNKKGDKTSACKNECKNASKGCDTKGKDKKK